MNCPDCNITMKSKYINFDYSEKCGINGVTLSDILELTCKKCKQIYHDLGSIDEINAMIADILLNANPLEPSHVKFIRNEIFKMSYFEFGKIIECEPFLVRDFESRIYKFDEDILDNIKMQLYKKIKTPKIIMGN